MAWTKTTLRSASALSAGLSAQYNIEGCRGAEAVVLVARNNADAAMLSVAQLECRDCYGGDGYMPVTDANETGDQLAAAPLNPFSSGTVTAGRRRRWQWGAGGCASNTLRVNVKAGTSSLGALSLDAYIWRSTQELESGTFSTNE